METKTEFKPGDVVSLKNGEAFIETRKHEATVHIVEGHRIWLTLGHVNKWNSPGELKLVRRANDTFIVGQQYQDIKTKRCKMIVLAVSPADPKRFYIEYSSHPHTSGSVFLHDAHQWEIYKEPIKVVRYYNMYPTHIASSASPTRDHADLAAAYNRIGCKRVEFVEGEFDE